MNAMIAVLMVGAGFTQAELDALPKPDPHFFDRLLDNKKPAREKPAREKHALQDLRSPQMRQMLAQKALQRRQRTRQHDTRSDYDPGMQAVMDMSRRFHANSFQRIW